MVSEDRGKLRISNSDRDEAVAHLQHALDEGRLELSEFDERTRAAYAAKTNAELDLVLDDLPVSRAADKEVHTVDLTAEERAEREQAVSERAHGRHGIPGSLHGLIWVAVPTIAIWLLSSLSSGEVKNFWPAWPIGIMTAIVVAEWLTGRRDEGC